MLPLLCDSIDCVRVCAFHYMVSMTMRFPLLSNTCVPLQALRFARSICFPSFHRISRIHTFNFMHFIIYFVHGMCTRVCSECIPLHTIHCGFMRCMSCTACVPLQNPMHASNVSRVCHCMRSIANVLHMPPVQHGKSYTRSTTPKKQAMHIKKSTQRST